MNIQLLLAVLVLSPEHVVCGFTTHANIHRTENPSCTRRHCVVVKPQVLISVSPIQKSKKKPPRVVEDEMQDLSRLETSLEDSTNEINDESDDALNTTSDPNSVVRAEFYIDGMA